MMQIKRKWDENRTVGIEMHGLKLNGALFLPFSFSLLEKFFFVEPLIPLDDNSNSVC